MENKFIHYNDYGPKEAPPLVLIHAFPLSHTMWAHQMEALSATYRIITYDIRGFGKSDAGDGLYTIELFVDDLIALMDELKIDKTIVCGLSMGGYIALRALERHPERFSALVLCDTRSEADTDEIKIKRATSIKLIKEKGVAAFADEFVKPVFVPDTFTINPSLIQTVKDIIVKNSPLGIEGALMALACRTDTTASLTKIKIPTLILVGEKDLITPPALALAMKEKIPNAEMHIIPQAGHLSNLENPQEFNHRLLEFLSMRLAVPRFVPTHGENLH